MRLYELEKYDMTNPLPVMSNPIYWEIMDEADQEIGEAHPSIIYQERVKKEAVNVSVPLNLIVTTEKMLSKSTVEHFQRIPSDEHPIAYYIDGKFILSDGNHRVVAEYLNGQKYISLLVIDAYDPIGKESLIHDGFYR